MANIVVSVPQNTITVDSTTNRVNVASTTNQVTVSEQARTSNADIRAAISVANLSGFGNLSYDQTNGIIQLAGVSSTEIRNSISNVAPILYNSSTGVIDIDANAVFTAKTTDDLAEGTTNLYLNGAGTTTDLTEGTNQYFTSGRARAALSFEPNFAGYVSASGNIQIPDSTTFVPEGANLYYTNARVDARMVTNLQNLGNGDLVFDITTSDTVLLHLDRSGLASPQANAFLEWDETNDRFRQIIPGVINGYIATDTDELNEGSTNLYLNGAGTTDDLTEGSANLYFTTARARASLSGANGISYSNVTGVIELSDSELISGVEAGNGLTGGGNTGNVTLDVGQGYGITVGADDIAFANSVLSTLTSDVTTTANVSGTNIIGNLQGNLTGTTADVTKINANHIVADINDLGTVSGNLSVDLNSGTTVLANIDGNITGISFTNIEAGSTVSLVIQQDAVGFRAIDLTTYAANWTNWQFVGNDSTLSTGANAEDVLTVIYDGTNYLASLVSFEADTNINVSGSITGGSLQINGDANITGNLEVTGNINYREVEDLLVQDQTITLNYGNASAQTSTIFVDRSGSTLNNAFIRWNETTDLWEIYDGTSTYTIPRSTTDLAEGTNLYYTTDRANTAIGAYQGDINTAGNITAEYFFANQFFEGDLNGAVTVDVYNNTGSQLNKGQPVYLTGTANGDNPHVALANAQVASEMPALGIVFANIADASVGQVVTAGTMNYASHGFALGSTLFINGAGVLQTTKPTGEGSLIQKIGKVIAPNFIEVQGAFRANETPNLDEGNIFLGDTNNCSRTVAPSGQFATTGNVFDLANVLTGVDTMRLDTTGSLVFTEQYGTNSTNSDVAKIDGEGYAIYTGRDGSFDNGFDTSTILTYSGTDDLRGTAIKGNVTAGSNVITITDTRTGFLAGSFDGSPTMSKLTEYMAWENGGAEQNSYPFPPNTYITSVDSGANTVTVSQNAAVTTTFDHSTQGGGFMNAFVDTDVGQIFAFLTQLDTGGGSASAIFVNQIMVPDAYGYPKSGPVIADFNQASFTDSGNVTMASLANYMKGRTSFTPEFSSIKASDGIAIGANASLSTRAEGDFVNSFGVNLLWDGQAKTGESNPNMMNQVLIKHYTDDSYQSTTQGLSIGGPRILFAGSYGNSSQLYAETYPRASQELGRIGWWGVHKENAIPVSQNPPAYLSVQAHDDWDKPGHVGTGPGGNADIYLAGTSNAATNKNDVVFSYDGGELVLASGKPNGQKPIKLAPAQQPSNSLAGGAAYGNPRNVYEYEFTWANVNYANTTASTGAQFVVTNSEDRQGNDGDYVLGLMRNNNDYSDQAIATGTAGGGGLTSGATFYQINSVFGFIPADSFYFGGEVAGLHGRQVTVSGATGSVGTFFNGNSYYVGYNSTLAGFGSNYDGFYGLYSDSGLTTPINSGESTAAAGGQFDWSVDLGIEQSHWKFTLASGSNNMVVSEDDVTHTTFYETGNIEVAGNITYNSITLPTADGSADQVIKTDGNGSLSFTTISGTGTVTSVDVAGGSGLTSSGGPITSSGTITVDVGQGTGITVNADDIEVDQGTDFSFTGNTSASNISLVQFQETVINMGNQGGNIAALAEFNAANGSIFTFTATSDFTISQIPNAQPGSSYTIKVTQDGTGDKALTSTFKFAGGDKTMSVAADAIDVISVVYDGTDYLASLTKAYA